jgi:hypothetical protein
LPQQVDSSLPNINGPGNWGIQNEVKDIPNRDLTQYLNLEDKLRSVLMHITTDKPVYRKGDVVIIEVFAVDAITKEPKM